MLLGRQFFEFKQFLFLRTTIEELCSVAFKSNKERMSSQQLSSYLPDTS